jgi:hypothetical protein
MAIIPDSRPKQPAGAGGPRCFQCGAPALRYEGATYCPECTRWAPARVPLTSPSYRWAPAGGWLCLLDGDRLVAAVAPRGDRWDWLVVKSAAAGDTQGGTAASLAEAVQLVWVVLARRR